MQLECVDARTARRLQSETETKRKKKSREQILHELETERQIGVRCVVHTCVPVLPTKSTFGRSSVWPIVRGIKDISCGFQHSNDLNLYIGVLLS